MPFGLGKKKQNVVDMTQRADLDEAGVKVTADERLDSRTQLLQQFEKDLDDLRKEIKDKGDLLTPEAYTVILEKMLSLLDNKVRQVAVAWGRAGTDRRFAIVMIAWEKLIAYGMDNITTLKAVLKAESVLNEIGIIEDTAKHAQVVVRDKMDMVRKCEKSLRYSWFPYGHMIIDFSFKELDVTTLKNIVIHSVTPPQRGYQQEGFNENEWETHGRQSTSESKPKEN